MQTTVICEMLPIAPQGAALRDTMALFAKGCMMALEAGQKEGTSNKVKIQRLIYDQIREATKLPANLAIRAIARAAWAMKAVKKTRRQVKQFRPTSIDYDERVFAYREHEEQVSLSTVSGRIHVPLQLGDFQRRKLAGKKPTAAKVVLKGREWFIHIVIDVEPGERIGPVCAIGIDRGIYNLAVTSMGKFHSGRNARHKRERLLSHRSRLQAKGTKSAKRALRRLSGREFRWMRDMNHCISRKLVDEAVQERAALVFEDLKGIRERTRRFSPKLNRMLNSWAFAQLESFVKYKAEIAGIEVISVPARGTSRTCPRCGTEDKSSRSGAHFQCVLCGYRSSADLAAARAIAERHACSARADVMQPNVAEGHSSVLSAASRLL